MDIKKELMRVAKDIFASIQISDTAKIKALNITKKDVEDRKGHQTYSKATTEECLKYCQGTGISVHISKDNVSTHEHRTGISILWLTTQAHGAG